MPSPTPAELSEARRRSGNLGGRPRKPTVTEARDAALEALIPVAIKVIQEHLERGGPDAWRAALQVFAHRFGRAPERIEFVAEDAEGFDLRSISQEQLQSLRHRLAERAATDGLFAP